MTKYLLITIVVVVLIYLWFQTATGQATLSKVGNVYTNYNKTWFNNLGFPNVLSVVQPSFTPSVQSVTAAQNPATYSTQG